jgi:hypothetical protein
MLMLVEKRTFGGPAQAVRELPDGPQGKGTFAPLNRNLTERLPATVGRMIRSYPKEVAPVLDEQLLAQMALWSWVLFVLWATPPIYQ